MPPAMPDNAVPRSARSYARLPAQRRVSMRICAWSCARAVCLILECRLGSAGHPARSGLRDRLAALGHAEQRLDNGTYGRSVRSGLPIPDERLAADPAAELTVEEARAQR